MDEEVYFKCEICGKKFPADPETMLECRAEFKAFDNETGEQVFPDEVASEEILKEAQNDPEVAPFLKGAICMCLGCQKKFAEEASEEGIIEKG